MTIRYESHKLDRRFNPSAGVGIEFESQGKQYRVLPCDESPRTVKGVITTWTGMTMGAVHYYGRFDVYSLDLCHVEDPNTRFSMSCRAFPPEADNFTVEVHRQLTKDEFYFDMTTGKQTSYGKRGDWREGWLDVDQLIQTMESEFARLFGKGWELISGSLAFDSWEDYKKRKLYMG